MGLPVTSIRAEAQHRPLLQAVANMLRAGRSHDVERFLASSAEVPVGPFRSSEAALGFMRDRLVTALRPDAIWLFGSRARGDHRLDSDFDLLVVLPDGLSEESYVHEAVADPVVASGLPYDIVPARWSEIVSSAERPGSLVSHALNEGRLIYKRRNFDLPSEIA